MVKFVKKCIQETIIKLNSLELFRVDRKLMIFLGFWPANFNKKKLIVIFCVLFTFDLLPKLNYFTKSILESDPQTFAVSCTEVMIIFLSNLAILNFIYYRRSMKKFLELLEFNWFKTTPIENPEWHKIRSQTAMFSNRIALFFRCALYTCCFLYCIIPYGIFFIKYYFLKMNVQIVTSTFVE